MLDAFYLVMTDTPDQYAKWPIFRAMQDIIFVDPSLVYNNHSQVCKLDLVWQLYPSSI